METLLTTVIDRLPLVEVVCSRSALGLAVNDDRHVLYPVALTERPA